MFYFKTNKLGFDAEFLGRVKLVAAVADLLGEEPPAAGQQQLKSHCGHTVLAAGRLTQARV